MHSDKVIEICKRNTAELYGVFDLLPLDVQPAILLAMVHIAREIEREVADEQALRAIDRPTPVVHNWAFQDVLELGAWLNAKLGVKLDDPGATVSVAIEQLERLSNHLAETTSHNVNLNSQVADLQRKLEAAHQECVGLAGQLDKRTAQVAELEGALEAAHSRPVTLQVVAAATPIPSINGHGNLATDSAKPANEQTARLLSAIPEGESELRKIVADLAVGATTWHRQPATTKRAIVLHLLPFINNGRNTMSQYDTERPNWMPTAQGITTLFGLRWTEVVDNTMRVMEVAC